MPKRILYAGLFAVVFLGLLILFIIKKFDKTEVIELQGAIPEDAVLFVEDINFDHLKEKVLPESRFWLDFLKITEGNALDSMLNALLLQIASSGALNELLTGEGFSFSLHKIGKDQLVPLFYLEYSHAHSDHEFENVILAMLEKN